MPIKNYTTMVAEDRTVGEIMGLLSAKGARSIQINYDEQGRPSGVSFVIAVENIPIPFQLPCNFEGVRRAMYEEFKDRGARARWERDGQRQEQVRRIAWRIVKDWVAAQMALIEAHQASLAQVFFPYATNNKGITAFDQFMATMIDPTRQLPESV
jgi:hypothetical protein